MTPNVVTVFITIDVRIIANFFNRIYIVMSEAISQHSSVQAGVNFRDGRSGQRPGIFPCLRPGRH